MKISELRTLNSLIQTIKSYFEKMSDSETDSDLSVEHYDVEDDLKAYGSPVLQTVDMVKENLPKINTRTQVGFFCISC
jgi:hypothetical protein